VLGAGPSLVVGDRGKEVLVVVEGVLAGTGKPGTGWKRAGVAG